jgi:hypothetical protein
MVTMVTMVTMAETMTTIGNRKPAARNDLLAQLYHY